MDSVLSLVTQTRTQNADGVWVSTPTYRQVFCQVSDITRAEFFQAGRNGLNPELQFTVFAADYNDEEALMYEGKPYGIYRTYHVPGTDYLELYVERKGGTNALTGNG